MLEFATFITHQDVLVNNVSGRSYMSNGSIRITYGYSITIASVEKERTQNNHWVDAISVFRRHSTLIQCSTNRRVSMRVQVMLSSHFHHGPTHYFCDPRQLHQMEATDLFWQTLQIAHVHSAYYSIISWRL